MAKESSVKKLKRETIKSKPKKKKTKAKNTKKTERKVERKKSHKEKTKNAKTKKTSRKELEESEEIDDLEELEELILPGQKKPTPPAGDATRAFYESLLEQNPQSIIAKKYLVDNGCLEPEKAKEFIKLLDKLKNKKK